MRTFTDDELHLGLKRSFRISLAAVYPSLKRLVFEKETMKLALRFWMMITLVSSVMSACNQTPEKPADPSAGAQPVNPEQPPKTGGAAAEGAKSGAAPAAPAPAAPQEVVNVPSGTLLTVLMADAVGTDTSKPGDTFADSLGESVIVNGKTVIAKGTKVQGRVETVDEPGRVKGKAALSLVLTQLVRKDKAYPIATEPFSAEAAAGTKGDAFKIGGGTAVGAVVGAIAGGKKGAAIGAGVGAGAGTGVVLSTKGKQLRIEPETKVNFVLKKGVEIVMTKSTS